MRWRWRWDSEIPMIQRKRNYFWTFAICLIFIKKLIKKRKPNFNRFNNLKECENCSRKIQWKINNHIVAHFRRSQSKIKKSKKVFITSLWNGRILISCSFKETKKKCSWYSVSCFIRTTRKNLRGWKSNKKKKEKNPQKIVCNVCCCFFIN